MKTNNFKSSFLFKKNPKHHQSLQKTTKKSNEKNTIPVLLHRSL